MNIIKIIKKIIHDAKDYDRLSKEYDLLMKSSKVVVIYPSVEIKGLENNHGALFLKGENCTISNVTMHVEDMGDVPATTCVMGNNMVFSSCNWFCEDKKNIKHNNT